MKLLRLAAMAALLCTTVVAALAAGIVTGPDSYSWAALAIGVGAVTSIIGLIWLYRFSSAKGDFDVPVQSPPPPVNWASRIRGWAIGIGLYLAAAAVVQYRLWVWPLVLWQLLSGAIDTLVSGLVPTTIDGLGRLVLIGFALILWSIFRIGRTLDVVAERLFRLPVAPAADDDDRR